MAILWIIVAVIYLAFPEQLYPYYYGIEYIWYGNTNFIEDKSLVALIGEIFHITQIWLIVGILLHFVIIANIFGLPLDICPIKRRTIPYYKCLDNAKYYVIFRNSLTISTFLAVISIISTIPRTEITDMTAGLGYISLFFLLFFVGLFLYNAFAVNRSFLFLPFFLFFDKILSFYLHKKMAFTQKAFFVI